MSYNMLFLGSITSYYCASLIIDEFLLWTNFWYVRYVYVHSPNYFYRIRQSATPTSGKAVRTCH